MDEKSGPEPEQDLDTTQAVTPPAAPEPTTQISQEELDRKMAQELARRGVAGDEVQRLMTVSRGGSIVPPPKKGPSIATPPELPPSEAFKPHPKISLPEFRESTAQERIEADRILTNANISRRRGLYKQAEGECRQALDLIPADAAALELYGDILQGSGRVDDAVFAYERAVKADPNRKTAEKKYAELTLAQNREIEMLREEFIPRNASISILFSAVFPGAGQLYNGETIKGILVAAAFLACMFAIFFSPYGLPKDKGLGLPTSLVMLLGAVAVLYLYAVVDANLSARRGGRRKSGWEV